MLVREVFADTLPYTYHWSEKFEYRSPECRLLIGTTACWIELIVVGTSIGRYEREVSLLYEVLRSTAIPDEESIFALDREVGRIDDEFPIEDVVYIFSFSSTILTSDIISECIDPDIPVEIREHITPSGRCHMDMDELSFFLMEMDTISWSHSCIYITS
jgi:hypothetical protein